MVIILWLCKMSTFREPSEEYTETLSCFQLCSKAELILQFKIKKYISKMTWTQTPPKMLANKHMERIVRETQTAN